MRLILLTDKAGRILAAHHRSMFPPLLHSSVPSATTIKPAEGQSLHDLEIPSELEQHVLQNSLAAELSKWKVEHDGKTVRLAKVS